MKIKYLNAYKRRIKFETIKEIEKWKLVKE